MEYLFIILTSLFLAITIFVIYSKVKRNKKIKRFQGKYHNFEDEDYEYENLKYIRKYWDHKKAMENPKFFIDDTTWNDLSMDHIFFKMNAAQSSIGEEYLYAKLRSVNFDLNNLKEFGAKIDHMDKNIEIKANALYLLNSLGKDTYNDVYNFIFNAKNQLLKNIYFFYILMSIPIICLIISIFSKIGFSLLITSIFINIIYHYRKNYLLEVRLNTIKYLKRMIVCGTNLSKLNYQDEEYKDKFKAIVKPIKKITFISNNLANTAAGDLEAIFEYLKTVLMLDFIGYNRMVKLLIKYTKEFHELYTIIGEIDSSIAISEYRKTLPFYSKPNFRDVSNIKIDDIYHPLVKNCVLNSIDMDKNIILTGSNASGKSTFIKSLALTMILSQNIYMCFCKEYTGKMCYTITSMAVKDDVLAKESYFIAEIKSLKRILDSLNEEVRIVCFIDEILKGTNTVERVAASSSILKYLYDKNALVITASHDIELTEIMENLYDNYHFRENITDEGVVFDYKLRKGYATTRNAILLLKFMGYDEKIVNEANNMAAEYMEDRKWSKIKKKIN